MIARVTVFKPTGEIPEWDGADGMLGGVWERVWVGPGRVQPNKDWRARPKEVGGEFDATQAVRVQIPIGKNELGAVRGGQLPFGTLGFGEGGFGGTLEQAPFVSYGPDPEFAKDFRVDIDYMPVTGSKVMETKQLIVRNALISSNAWVYNLLCDVGTNASHD